MMTRWIGLVNRLLLLFALLAASAALLIWLWPAHSTTTLAHAPAIHSGKERFEWSIDGPLLDLKYEPAAVRLPDLSGEFIYTGLNDRPDAKSGQQIAHIQLQGDEEPCALALGEQLFLSYEDGSYHLCSEPTSLWITAKTKGDLLECTVSMTNQQGGVVTQPKEHQTFSLGRTQIQKNRRDRWYLGSYRADNSLLARMRAQWFGPDQLLSLHGESDQPTHRLDFGDDENHYSCFVREGGVLYWDADRWNQPSDEIDTTGYPLLRLTRCEEKLAHVDVWDVAGKSQLSIKLIRHREGWAAERLSGEMKLAGARSWSRFILEGGGDRIEISPDDWLVQREGEWHKLETVEAIEAVVAGKVDGELLIIEEIERSEGRTQLHAHLFSPMRSEVATLTLPLLKAGQGE